jgi:ATP-dependent phosphoenolpyruvate carboxykinase
VDEKLLVPWRAWGDPAAWEGAARRLAGRFRENFRTYAAEAGAAVAAAGPA